MSPDARVGAVVIGRNEGARLVACLASVTGHATHVVYVDSGSADNSIANARAAGVEVIGLDLAIPFTAARARNAGFAALLASRPDIAFVQFIDGDCVLQPGWMAEATAFLCANPKAAIACGRRRERHPQASIFNRLCDREWDTPVGPALACGGDALIRVEPLREACGFDPTLIAGEEPELCVRLRAAGWEVWRLDAEMTLHDAAMSRFGQWWRRSMRGGYAAAEGMAMHGGGPDRHRVREVRRAVAWALGIPLATLAAVAAAGPLGLGVLAVYPAQVLRLVMRRGATVLENWEEALFLMLAKWPETFGVFKYWIGRVAQRPGRLIEYK